MQEILEQLIELQKLDSKIASIEGVLKNTPSQIKVLKEKLEKAESGLNSIKAELEENKKSYNELQSSLEKKKEYLDNSQKKITSVQNTKEYESVLRELESLKKLIAEEDALLKEKLNLNYQYESDLSKNQELKDSLEKELDEKSNVKLDEEKDLRAELETLEKERAEFASKIKKSSLMKYERVRQHRHNIGIASVKDEVCNGCYMHIPPQLYVEVKKDNEVHTCPHCQRILYYIPAKTTASEEETKKTSKSKKTKKSDSDTEN